MEDRQQTRRIPVSVVASVAALVVAVGGGTAWWASRQTATPPVTSTTPVPTATVITPLPSATLQPSIPTPKISVTPVQQPKAQVFWLKDAGDSTELIPVEIALNKAAKPSDALEAAFNQLLAGPNDPSTFSTIPQGTKLRGVTVKDDGVHLDLSPEFNSGGGSATMIGRLAQVLFTATSLEPKAKVWISVEGKPLELLGGEGLEVPQPMTRQNFEKEFPL